MKLAAAALLLLLGSGIGQAIGGRPTVVACFEIKDQEVKTLYVDTGVTAYYPLGSEATVESSEGVTRVHGVVWLREPRRVWLPGVFGE